MATIIRKAEFPRITYGTTKAVEDCWQIFHTESDLEVYNLIAANIPGTFLVETTLLQLQSFTPEYQGGGFWEVPVRYAEKLPGGDTGGGGGDAGTGGILSFEIGGGTTKLTQCITVRQTAAIPGAGIADHKKAIGWDGEKVNGIDDISPVFNWTETHQGPAMSIQYLRTLEELCGQINAEAFRGHQPEEVRFMGASGSTKNAGVTEIAFKFAGQKEKSDLTIGDITGINKKGWDYLDIQYGMRVDQNWLAPRPIIVRVEKVFETGDFSKLGIGS